MPKIFDLLRCSHSEVSISPVAIHCFGLQTISLGIKVNNSCQLRGILISPSGKALDAIFAFTQRFEGNMSSNTHRSHRTESSYHNLIDCLEINALRKRNSSNSTFFLPAAAINKVLRRPIPALSRRKAKACARKQSARKVQNSMIKQKSSQSIEACS